MTKQYKTIDQFGNISYDGDNIKKAQIVALNHTLNGDIMYIISYVNNNSNKLDIHPPMMDMTWLYPINQLGSI